MDQPVGPFGQPDGALGAIKDQLDDFVEMAPSTGVGRSAEDSSIRVVAGRMGAGKSLYLRRMQDFQSQNESVFAAPVSKNASDIDTEDIALFSKCMEVNSGNTEAWKRLWRRAIVRSGASYLFAPRSPLMPRPSDEHLEEAESYADLLGEPQYPRRVTAEAAAILNAYSAKNDYEDYLKDPRWADVEALIDLTLREVRPLYLYVDAIDDNFKWAPSLWTQCQRGLYFAVMDLLRESDTIGGRLHVVISIRDITLASIRASEHAPRYDEQQYTNLLGWDRKLITEFLREKLQTIDDRFFVDPERKTLDSFVGHTTVTPGRRPGAEAEDIETYFVRHTRLVPRDVIILGNRLCNFIENNGHEALTEEEFKKLLSSSSQQFATSQLEQAANQLWSDLLPLIALEQDWDYVYLSPNDHQIHENRAQLISAIETTMWEEFPLQLLEELEAVASEKFDGAVHAGNVLWQNALIGTKVGEQYNFYSLIDISQIHLPRDSGGERTYVWNPLIFDVLPTLKATLPRPCWPHG